MIYIILIFSKSFLCIAHFTELDSIHKPQRSETFHSKTIDYSFSRWWFFPDNCQIFGKDKYVWITRTVPICKVEKLALESVDLEWRTLLFSIVYGTRRKHSYLLYIFGKPFSVVSITIAILNNNTYLDLSVHCLSP